MNELSKWVWETKYRGPEDKCLDDTWRRVARAIAAVEGSQSAKWEQQFFEIMRAGWFLPGGRIIAGAGLERDVTLVNCFVSGTIADSMDGIMTSLHEAATTLRAGGGIGMDFSTIRPRGAPVKSLGATASGPVSFMQMWDTMCGTVMSAGQRRGAMMACLRVDHPDIEEFVSAKQTAGRLTNFNISVTVTDDFMQAVRERRPFSLRFGGVEYRTVDAADLWDTILRSTYEYSEPGVIFVDRVNKQNLLRSVETIAASNPCGEQMLPPYGACVLGSLNLASLVYRSPSGQYQLDDERLQEATPTAVRFLDNVIDVTRYPLPQQEAESKRKRRIGLGVTGLGCALALLGVPYGSDKALELTRFWLSLIQEAAIDASCELARVKGAFPSSIGAYKRTRRNSHLMSIAPTGTISLLAGNVSGGIEPIFAAQYSRALLQADGTRRIVIARDFAVEKADLVHAPSIVTSGDLTPEQHIAMAAAAQSFVDSAISKTVNCPASIQFDQFKQVYDLAYDSGMKGCSTYRPSSVRGSILEAVADNKTGTDESSATGETNVIPLQRVSDRSRTERPRVLEGRTYKIKPAEHAYYVTITDIVDNDHRQPFELFIATRSVDSYPWIMALSRMVSAVFRRGGDVVFVADELKQVFDPRGGHWSDQKYVPSLVAAIGDVIAEHMASLNADGLVTTSARARHCPRCQRGALVQSEGCERCSICDYTKC